METPDEIGPTPDDAESLKPEIDTDAPPNPVPEPAGDAALVPAARRDLIPRPRDGQGLPVKSSYVYGPVLPAPLPFAQSPLARTVALIGERRPDLARNIEYDYTQHVLPALETIGRVRHEEERLLPERVRQAGEHNAGVDRAQAEVRTERDAALKSLRGRLEAADERLAEAHAVAGTKFAEAGGPYDPKRPSDDGLPHPQPRSAAAVAAEMHLPWRASAIHLPPWLHAIFTAVVGFLVGINLGMATHVLHYDTLARHPFVVTIAWAAGAVLAEAAWRAMRAVWFFESEYFYLGRPMVRFWAALAVALLVTVTIVGADVATVQLGLLAAERSRTGLFLLSERGHFLPAAAPAGSAALWWVSLIFTLAFIVVAAAEGYSAGRHDAVQNIVSGHQEADLRERQAAFRADPAVRGVRRAHADVLEMTRQRGQLEEKIAAESAPFEARLGELERQRVPGRRALQERMERLVQDAHQDAVGASEELRQKIREAQEACHGPAAGRRGATAGRGRLWAQPGSGRRPERGKSIPLTGLAIFLFRRHRLRRHLVSPNETLLRAYCLLRPKVPVPSPLPGREGARGTFPLSGASGLNLSLSHAFRSPPMLSQLFEALIISLVNLVTRATPHRGTGRSTAGFSRFLGRGAAPAGPTLDAPPPDPPVVVGDVVPSPREALRQPGAGPREAVMTTGERLKHLYVTGGTGAGKTTLLMNLIDADVDAGRGVGFLDFRGEMVDRILARLAARYAPEELADRLLLIDLRAAPADTGAGAYSVGFDPLRQGRDPYSQALFVMDVLRSQFGGSLGCQTEELCRNMLLAMALSPERPTLADIEVFLTSTPARAALLAGVEDGGVRRFFGRFEALPEAQRGQWVSPVMNKISPMLALPALRRLLGDRRSVSLRGFLDARPDAILLACLAADEIFGAASLVGTLLVSAVASALMRSDRKATAPFFLYLDEFQNVAGASGDQFATMVSEARRFSLGLTLSHQSTSQLDPGLRVLVRNVVAGHVVFATGGVDADLLAGEIASDEPKAALKQLLLSQKPGEALLVRRGEPTARIKTRYAPDPPVAQAAVRALRDASLSRHGRPAAEVDAEMSAREAALLPPTPLSRKSAPTKRPPRPAKAADEYEVRDCDGREGHGHGA